MFLHFRFMIRFLVIPIIYVFNYHFCIYFCHCFYNWCTTIHCSLCSFALTDTVYPKKYAHGFCFAVLCCGYTLTDFPISIRLTSLALWQSNDGPSASKATLMNMDKYFMWIHYERLHNHNKAKHNKTVCIFLGIYCSLPIWCQGVTIMSSIARFMGPTWDPGQPVDSIIKGQWCGKHLHVMTSSCVWLASQKQVLQVESSDPSWQWACVFDSTAIVITLPPLIAVWYPDILTT